MNNFFLSSCAVLALLATSCESSRTPYIRGAGDNHAGSTQNPNGGSFDTDGTLILDNDFTHDDLNLNGEGTIVPESQHGFTPVLFAFDSATIGSGYNNKLTQLANYLIQNPTYTLTIEGHSDERGSEEYNRALSEQRALSVQQFLAQISADLIDRVNTVGYGEEKPADLGKAESSFQQNRRAAFVIRDRK